MKAMRPAAVAIVSCVLVSASLAGAQTLQTLCSFRGTNGANPNAALVLGTDGNFYGTTAYGGTSNCGTIFQVTTNGTLTTLVSFTSKTGASPLTTLTLGADGNFYGTTAYGPTNTSVSGFAYGMGTVFKMTPNGTLTTMASFNITNGANPEAALTPGNDGNFYGTTQNGGSGITFIGNVFKFTTNGALTSLVYFKNYTEGQYPEAALTLGTDGNFYGTTSEGGTNNEFLAGNSPF